MKKNILNKRKQILTFVTGVFLLLAIFGFLNKKLVVGMDFVGGVKMEYKISKHPEDVISEIKGGIRASSTVVFTEDTIIIKITKSNEKETELREKIEKTFDKHSITYTLVSFDNMSPKFGTELRDNALISIILSFIVILIYVFYRYELLFSFSAIFTLVHDVAATLVVLLLFSIEINTSTIAAILTLIGYSLNDTIILFDRIRSILREGKKEIELKNIITLSIDKNLSRMFLTSLTTLFTITALLLFGGEELYSFSVTLFFGIIIGTYSSVFLSSTLLEVMKFSVPKYREKYEKILQRRREKEDLRRQFSHI